jgi:hypothetical protein
VLRSERIADLQDRIAKPLGERSDEGAVAIHASCSPPAAMKINKSGAWRRSPSDWEDPFDWHASYGSRLYVHAVNSSDRF